MSENDGNKIFKVSKNTIIKHERVLIKQIVLISSEPELIQGALDMFPAKVVQVPNYAGTEKQGDESSFSYKMIQTDPLGERKISAYGELQNGRSYLMDTFTLSNSAHILVLVSDLMKALQYDRSEIEFLEEYSQLLPLQLNEDEKAFLKKGGLLQSDDNTNDRYITAKSAFVRFGAATIASGVRVIDDYWESLAKEQGFTPHHRVCKLSKRLLDILIDLKPTIQYHSNRNANEEDSITNDQNEQNYYFENPYLTVSEQISFEVRQEYGREFSKGEHIGAVIPGQNINGSLEISSQFKIPKYHNKNSFQQAIQQNAMNTPIGSPSQLEQQQRYPQSQQSDVSRSTNIGFSPGSLPLSGKSGKRLLNSILDTDTLVIKRKKSEENELIKSTNDIALTNEQLNINGWKFESLPLTTDSNTNNIEFSPRGLPFYQKDRLIKRLKLLTPNQVREIEHLHDSLFLNTGLQNVRKLRAKKWTKYWQHKSGVSVGLRNIDVPTFKNRYLKEILEQTKTVTVYNELTNMDEISITKRVPNANFLGHSNIHGFKPPYANAPVNIKQDSQKERR